MNEKIIRLEKLKERTKNLKMGDQNEIDDIRSLAAMVIRHCFGGFSTYLGELKRIVFCTTNPNQSTYPSYQVMNWNDSELKMLRLFDVMIEDLKLSEPEKKEPQVADAPYSRSKVFLVHGKDEEMKQSVARAIEKLGLEPVILHEQPNKGRTIIEKFTDYSDVGFAVVLLSPDDRGNPKEINVQDGRLRARQNVVFELGFFIGKLGRENVMPIYRECLSFEMPSDYAGVLYVPFDANGQWKFKLAKELNACGYKVDANRLL